MTEDRKVSIIIPAYNVEKYIQKCAKTILRQTYSNIEVIFVDDGSTDQTSVILEKISQQDNRVVVINKKNGGVSSARNAGLVAARGEYVIFVDGDDYLSADHVEYMLELARKTRTEFCISKNCFTRKNEAQIEQDSVEILNSADATALLLSPEVVVGCWNKIYKKSFLDEHNLRFATDLFYGEGLSFIIKMAQKSDRIGVGSRKVYYYRRNNQMSATTKFDIQKLYNGENALNRIGSQIQCSNQKTADMLTLHNSIFALGALTRVLANGCRKQYKKDYIRWQNCIRYNLRQILNSKYISLYRKTMLLGGSISPWLMMKLDAMRRKTIENNSVE